VLVVLLKACGGAPLPAPAEIDFATPAGYEQTTPPAEAATAPQPARGGTLHVAMPMPQTLNPLLNSDRDLAQVLRLIFEPIVVFDNELRPFPNPAIIENITFAPSGQALTITLRDNIFWEDGVAITANDIAFSINVLQNHAPATAIYRANAAPIAAHSVVDPRNLHVSLHTPMWAVMYYLNFPIIPAHYYTGVPMGNLTHARNMHPVGNGAFRFHSYVLAQRLELFANENAPGGMPYIDKVVATVLRDMDDTIHAFERGIIDVFVGELASWGRLRAAGLDLSGTIAGNEFDFVGFNHARTLFNEAEMRQVVAQARAIGGNQLPIQSSSWLGAEMPSIPAVSFAQLGFELGEYGILQRQLSPALPPIPLGMTVIVNEENLRTVRVAEDLHANLSTQGVAVSLYILPADVFTARLNSGDFDIMVGTIELDSRPNFEFLRTGNRSAGNLMGHSSADFDRLLDNMNLATNANAFADAAHAVFVYLTENLPIIGLGIHDTGFYTSPRLHGNLTPAGREIFIDVYSWFLVDR